MGGKRPRHRASSDVASPDEKQCRASPVFALRTRKRRRHHARNRGDGVILSDDAPSERRLELGNLEAHGSSRRGPATNQGGPATLQCAPGRERAQQETSVDAFDSKSIRDPGVDRIQQRARDRRCRGPRSAALGALEDTFGAARHAERPPGGRTNRSARIAAKMPSQPDRVDPARGDRLVDDPVTEAQYADQDVQWLDGLGSGTRRLGNCEIESVSDVVTVGHGAASRDESGASVCASAMRPRQGMVRRRTRRSAA
jgi:hypothetical protein